MIGFGLIVCLHWIWDCSLLDLFDLPDCCAICDMVSFTSFGCNLGVGQLLLLAVIRLGPKNKYVALVKIN